jgi:galactose mutarotase-like enzyme
VLGQIFTEPRQHGCRIVTMISRGHEQVVLENEVMSVRVLASKGADIAELRHKATDVNLLWQGLTELRPQGSYVETAAREQGSFLDYFHGGWQELFPNGGFACTYEGARLGQHGEVSVLPWHVHVLKDEEESVAVRFWTDTVRMPFRIEKTLTLTAGSPELMISWTISNRSPRRLHYSWGQHPGFGPPFLSDDCIIDLPGGNIRTAAEPLFPGYRLKPGQVSAWPRGVSADGSSISLDRVSPVAARTHDVLHVEKLPAGWAAIRNPARQLGLALSWDLAQFPYLWLWQVYGGMADYPGWGALYHVAIEPFTGPLGSLTENIASENAPTLAGGDSLTTHMTVILLAGERTLSSFGQKTASAHWQARP